MKLLEQCPAQGHAAWLLAIISFIGRRETRKDDEVGDLVTFILFQSAFFGAYLVGYLYKKLPSTLQFAKLADVHYFVGPNI